MAPHELQAIEKTMPTGIEQLDEIQSQVAILHRMNDNGQLQQDRRATRTTMALVPTHRLLHTYCPVLRLLLFTILLTQNLPHQSTSKRYPSAKYH